MNSLGLQAHRRSVLPSQTSQRRSRRYSEMQIPSTFKSACCDVTLISVIEVAQGDVLLNVKTATGFAGSDIRVNSSVWPLA